MYAISRGELEDGLSVVAVPVLAGSGATVAALAVAGPRDRFGDQKIPELVRALHDVGAEMNGKPLVAFAEFHSPRSGGASDDENAAQRDGLRRDLRT